MIVVFLKVLAHAQTRGLQRGSSMELLTVDFQRSLARRCGPTIEVNRCVRDTSQIRSWHITDQILRFSRNFVQKWLRNWRISASLRAPVCAWARTFSVPPIRLHLSYGDRGNCHMNLQLERTNRGNVWEEVEWQNWEKQPQIAGFWDYHG